MAQEIHATLDQVKDVANGVIAKVRAKEYALNSVVQTLIGSDSGKSVRTIANEELAAQLIPSNAKEALDTLQEIAAWIQDHPDEAAAINTKLTLGTYEDGGEQKQYATVKAYVEAYVASQLNAAELSGSNAIDISNNTVSLIVDTANANGIEVTASGLKLGLATPSTNGTGGSNGAMSAVDKEKLDNADVTAYTGGNGIDVTNHGISAVVAAANGLSVDGTNGIQMALVSASTDGTGGSNGAMSAVDKEKLDNIRIATAAEVTAAINALDSL